MVRPMTRPTLSLDGFVPYRLSVASNSASDMIASAYRSLFGLNVSEWRLIAVLAEGEARTQQELCTATRMDKVTVSRAATTLADRGLVERAPNRHDKRSHLLSLTESGWTLYAQVAPKALELEKGLLADFSAAEVEALVGMLRRVEIAAERMR